MRRPPKRPRSRPKSRRRKLDLDRFQALLTANAGSVKQRDDAQARLDTAIARQRAAQDRVRSARETQARLEAGTRPEEIQAARARVEAADAQIAVLEKSQRDANVLAPISGIVTQKLVDAGEIVAARNAARRDYGSRSCVGESVRAGADGAARRDWAGGDGRSPTREDRASTARSRSSRRAPSSRPRNVQTAEERSKLVYRIKVSVDNRAGVLKLGMPVDARVEAPMSAISFVNVAKRYGATRRSPTSASTSREGEMFGLIGPDGAGKTTAIRLMCGLLHADAGELRVLGLDPVKDHRPITERVGYLSQRFSLYGDLTIDENIAFFAEVHGVRDYHRRRDQLLSMTQLTPFRDRLADRLSGGMKQKLALACTLVHEPTLILLDEPTTGVDPISRREFWKLLSEFLAHGITILMSTPYLDEAERCSRVALLHQGRVLAMDEPARPAHAHHGPDARSDRARASRG